MSDKDAWGENKIPNEEFYPSFLLILASIKFLFRKVNTCSESFSQNEKEIL